MVNEISLYDSTDQECLVIKFDDQTARLLQVLIYSSAMHDFLPIDLSSKEPEVLRTIEMAKNKINQFYENEEINKRAEQLRGVI